jgi:hypothetical protein
MSTVEPVAARATTDAGGAVTFGVDAYISRDYAGRRLVDTPPGMRHARGRTKRFVCGSSLT